MNPYHLVRKKHKEHNTIIEVNSAGGDFQIGAGFCSVMASIGFAEILNDPEAVMHLLTSTDIGVAGVDLSDGCLEPASSQGLGSGHYAALKSLRMSGLTVMSGIVDFSQLDLLYSYVDIFQVPSRHMQNYPLLEALGGIGKPVILERGCAATVEEWLMAAEYIMIGGNQQVILCESGIRTFESLTRRTLDISAISLAKTISHLPVIAYPGQAANCPELVLPLSKAAVAAGADAVIADLLLCQPELGGAASKQFLGQTPASFVECIKKQAALENRIYQ